MRSHIGKKGHTSLAGTGRTQRRRMLLCVFAVVTLLVLFGLIHASTDFISGKMQPNPTFSTETTLEPIEVPTTIRSRTVTTTTSTTLIPEPTTTTETSTSTTTTTTASSSSLPPETNELNEENTTTVAPSTREAATDAPTSSNASTAKDAPTSPSARGTDAPTTTTTAARADKPVRARRRAGPAGEAVVPAVPIRHPAPKRKEGEDPEERVWFDPYTSVLHVRVSAASSALSFFPNTTTSPAASEDVEMLFPLIHVRDRSKRTVAAEQAYAAGNATDRGDAAATAQTSEVSEACVLPLTELDATVVEDAQTLKDAVKDNMGSPHKRWQQKLTVYDAFQIPSWASAGEQNALRHGSIFVSLAGYRDRECAATVYDIFKQSSSPHRLYLGISDERNQRDYGDDLSCLASIMHDQYTPLDSLSETQWTDRRNLREKKKVSTSAPEPDRTPEEWHRKLLRLNAASMSLRENYHPHVRKMLYGAATPHAVMPLFSASYTWESLLQQHNDYYKEAQQRYTAERGGDSTAEPLPLLSNLTILQTGDLLKLPVVKDRMSSHVLSDAEKAADRTNLIPRQSLFLDDHYPTDKILCIGGEAERLRDLFLLDDDVRQRYEGMTSSKQPQQRTPFPHFRRGRGGAQEAPLQPLAGCRVIARTAEHTAARGPTYGRYITSLFYFNQDFYMMIDSHTRFAPDFDTKFIVNLFQVARHGVLSHYPNGYTPAAPTEEFTKVDMMSMCTAQVLVNGMPKLGARWRPFQVAPIPEAFAAAGFLFGDAQYALDVPFDPLLPYLFDGEEIMYSARLWTSGWDILCPSGGYLFHYYGRERAHRDWGSNTNANQLRQESERRVLYLLQRYQPWAATLEAHAKEASRLLKEDKPTEPPPAYVPPEQRRIVPEDVAAAEPYLRTYKSYLGLGTQRALEAYWEFTELTDTHIQKRDSEQRWMGGESLCARKVETEDEE